MKRTLSILSLVTVLLLADSEMAKTKAVVVPMGGQKTQGDAFAQAIPAWYHNGGGTEGGYANLPSGKIRTGETISGETDMPAAPPAQTFINSIGMTFNLIPAGTFTMGSPECEPGHQANETQHNVTLTEPFYMQTTEVTQGQWLQVMGSNPSSFSTCGLDCPVEQVSWVDANSFIKKLNEIEGRNCEEKPCYSLPTEAQWEYAARGGTSTAFSTGDITSPDCDPVDSNPDAIGWVCGNTAITTHPVAQKAQNYWGLYGMSGNVWEWCADWYRAYPAGPVTDPLGPETGSDRVVRGGSWNYLAGEARSVDRLSYTPTFRFVILGFRLVLPPGQ